MKTTYSFYWFCPNSFLKNNLSNKSHMSNQILITKCSTGGKYQPNKANTPVRPPTVSHPAPPPSSVYLSRQSSVFQSLPVSGNPLSIIFTSPSCFLSAIIAPSSIPQVRWRLITSPVFLCLRWPVRGRNLAIVNSSTRISPGNDANDVNKQVTYHSSRTSFHMRTEQPYLVNACFCNDP